MEQITRSGLVIPSSETIGNTRFERYWSTAVAVQTLNHKDSAIKYGMLEELATRVTSLNRSVEILVSNREDATDFFGQRTALALRLLLARKSVSDPREFPVSASIFKFKPGELLHPFSANQVEVGIPKADGYSEATLRTSLLDLVPYYRAATKEDTDAAFIASYFFKGHGSKTISENEDQYIARRAFEVLHIGYVTKGIPGDSVEAKELLKLREMLVYSLWRIWIERKQNPEKAKSAVQLQIGRLYDRDGGLIEFRVVTPSNKEMVFRIPSPWKYEKPTARIRNMFQDFSKARVPFDYSRYI